MPRPDITHFFESSWEANKKDENSGATASVVHSHCEGRIVPIRLIGGHRNPLVGHVGQEEWIG